MHRGTVVGLVAFVVLLGAGPAHAGQRLVGQAAGSGAFVAVVQDGPALVAYVCDGKGISQWFDGRARGRGPTTLRGRAGARLTVSVRPGSATGRVRLGNGRTLRFRLTPARGRARGGPAGLFRQEGSSFAAGRRGALLTGWIRLNDGRVRGRTEVTSAARTTTLTPITQPPPSAALIQGTLTPPCSPPRLNPQDPLGPLAPQPGLNLCRFASLPTRSAPLAVRVVPAPSGATLTQEEIAAVAERADRALAIRRARLGVPVTVAERPEVARVARAIQGSTLARAARDRLEDGLAARDARRVQAGIDDLRRALPGQTGTRTETRRPLPDTRTVPPAEPGPAPPATRTLRPRDFVTVLAEFQDRQNVASATNAGDRVSVISLTNAPAGQLGHATATATFDVPAGVQRVRLRLRRLSIFGQADVNCLLGASSGSWTAGVVLFRRDAAGLRGPAVVEALQGEEVNAACLIASPPNVPFINALRAAPSDATIVFTAPEGGGSFGLMLLASSFANNAGMAQALSDATAGLDSVDITFE